MNMLVTGGLGKIAELNAELMKWNVLMDKLK